MAHVLIVDDDRALCETSIQRLIKDGHHPQSVASVKEALAHLEKQPVDVIIAKVEMPRRSGIELIEDIARRGFEVETILVTAEASMQSVRAATWAGS